MIGVIAALTRLAWPVTFRDVQPVNILKLFALHRFTRTRRMRPHANASSLAPGARTEWLCLWRRGTP